MSVFEGIILGTAIAAVVTIVVTTLRVGITPMPSSRKACEAIASAIPPNTDGPIIDLGSGWGTIVFSLAQSFPQATIKGIELSPIPWAVSRVGAFLRRSPNLEIQRGNFRDIQLEHAKVVVCYLFPGGMAYLKTKFENELKPNTLVVSNTFRLAGWEPEQVITLNDIHKTPIYRYRVPTDSN